MFHQLLDRAALAFQLGMPGRRLEPHLAGGRDRGQVIHPLGQLGQELLVVAEGGIAGDPLAGKELAAPQLGQQSERDLRLGLEGEVLGQATVLAFFLVGVIEPALGQIEPGVQQRVALGAGAADEHPGLAVGRLAQGPAILRGHAHRVMAFLGELAGIKAPDALRIAQAGRGQFPVLLAHPGLVPFVIGEEALEIAHRRGPLHFQRHRLHILALGIA